MEMMLGKQAGGGMVNSLEDQARSFGFGPAGRDAHTRASVDDGGISGLINDCTK